MKTNTQKYHLVLALKFSFLCWILTCGLALLVSHFVSQSEQSRQQTEMLELIEEAVELYHSDGLESLVEVFELAENETWTKEEAQEHWQEEGWLMALYQKDVTIAGGDIGFERANTANPQLQTEIDEAAQHIFYQAQQINDGLYLHLWQRLDHDVVIAQDARKQFIVWLAIFCWLPPLLIFVYFRQMQGNTITKLSQQLSLVAKAPELHRTVAKSDDPQLLQLCSVINTMLDEITKLHHNIKTMSVGVAHDLKTPLTRVANRLQSMSQDIDDPVQLAVHLEKACEELEKIISTFNNLIRLNSIESGKYQQGFKQIDLSTLLLDLTDSFAPVFEDAEKTLSVSILPNISCYGDADLLAQLVCNLLENALEYTNPRASVWIRLQSHSSGVLLQIGDNGPGIATSDQAHIFERFYRADTSRSSSGNGLGLSIVKAICDIHEARIYLLEGQPGAVFNIEVPTH
ncbi:HAMP domain-containing sensor histidine kinase [Pseudoalteromonas sp. PS5]|uniref:sensor histidine kinase n=1 Tax=Pseudoalteromonas sp. PS5 TaxID=1437473 RepID=UPI000FFEB5C4|nr:HAMP domain-containing sensor histidine kinase [Pseudoalteromonas sp. PS5]RXE97841.1 sensor histidine kinase [Pseudoalteromonas sp. PS5]